MKRTFTCICVLMLKSSVFGLVMGDKPYRIEVSKVEENSITLDVINLRKFQSVEEAGHWCFQTHKRTEKGEVWYSNVVCLDFSETFTSKEIEKICAVFIQSKIYPSRIRKERDGRFETITNRYSPGSIWSPKNKGLN